MKKTISLVLVLALGMVGEVARSQTSTHVVGADDPASDVQAVQGAVDTYDIVHLQGTFDFGTTAVRLTKDVEILGQGKDASGNYLTRITGVVQDPAWRRKAFFLSETTQVRIVCRDLELNGSEFGMFVRTAGHLEITGCLVKCYGAGIRIQPYGAGTPDVIGEIIIDNTEIDGSNFGVFTQCAGL